MGGKSEQLTATSPIGTTIDVGASTGGSIARCAVIGPSSVNTSRSHCWGRCDHNTAGWTDDAGTLIGVEPDTTYELGGIDSKPGQGR